MGVLRLLGVALLSLATLTLGATAAHSAARLVSSSPQDGATLDESPTQVTLVFDEPLVQGADTMSLSDASGNVIFSSTVVPVASSVTLPVPAGLPAGTYEVAFRVASADGSPLDGAITFSVATAASASATPQQGASAAPRPDVNPRAGDPTFPILPVVLMAVLALALLGLIALILGPRTRHNRYDDPGAAR